MGGITNYTGDGKQKSFEELFCLAELTEGLHRQLILFSMLNIFLSITAFLANTLILVALSKEASLHPPSKLLLRSLATHTYPLLLNSRKKELPSDSLKFTDSLLFPC